MRKPNITPLSILVSGTIALLLLIVTTVKPTPTTAGVSVELANRNRALTGTAFIWQTFSRQFIAPFSAY